MSQYKVIVSEEATQMLVAHAAFLAKVSQDAAYKMIYEFQVAADSLKEMPMRCAWFSNEFFPSHLYRFIVFSKRYMLLFKIVENNVFVDYVLDERQENEWLF